jgi:hypothetical protein
MPLHVPPSLPFPQPFLAVHIISPQVLAVPIIISGVELGLYKHVKMYGNFMYKICTNRSYRTCRAIADRPVNTYYEKVPQPGPLGAPDPMQGCTD